MIDPSTLTTALIQKLQAIPELIALLDGDPARIFAYEDQFPASVSIYRAIFEMPDGSVMVAWNGTAQGNVARNEVWAHQFSLYLKGGKGVKFTSLWAAIANGVPAGGGGQNFRRTEIHSSCYPIFERISAQRRTLQVTEQSSLDYLECPLILREKSDG